MTTRCTWLGFVLAFALTGAAAAEEAAPGAADFGWRPAPRVKVTADRKHLLSGPKLEQIVAGAARQKTAPAPSGKKTSRAVVEGELSPVRYRRIIRRYFELIRTVKKGP